MAGGTRDEDHPYSKLVAMQYWLLGYEVPESIVMFAQDPNNADNYRMYFVASKKKGSLMLAVIFVLCFFFFSFVSRFSFLVFVLKFHC